jgi:hypothetical protein
MDVGIPDGYQVRTKNTFIEISPSRKGGSAHRSHSCDGKFKSLEAMIDDDMSDSPTTASTRSVDSDKAKAEENDAIVNQIFDTYIANTDNQGYTLMLHGVQNRLQDEDLLELLLDLGVPGFQYLYLPPNHWQRRQNPSNMKTRNKGYAFVHFTTEALANNFTKVVENAEGSMYTTPAVNQGISASLQQMTLVNRKRTVMNGRVCLAMDGEVFHVSKEALWRKRYKTISPRQ